MSRLEELLTTDALALAVAATLPRRSSRPISPRQIALDITHVDKLPTTEDEVLRAAKRLARAGLGIRFTERRNFLACDWRDDQFALVYRLWSAARVPAYRD